MKEYFPGTNLLTLPPKISLHWACVKWEWIKVRWSNSKPPGRSGPYPWKYLLCRNEQWNLSRKGGNRFLLLNKPGSKDTNSQKNGAGTGNAWNRGGSHRAFLGEPWPVGTSLVNNLTHRTWLTELPSSTMTPTCTHGQHPNSVLAEWAQAPAD